MAIIRFGALIVGARGTLGGATLSANASSTYAKAWARPSNRQSQTQTAHRAALGTLATLYRDLTPSQQSAWATYASDPAQQLVNQLGETYYASAFNWFTSINLALRSAGAADRSDPPSLPTPPAPVLSSLIYDVSDSPTPSRVVLSALSPSLAYPHALAAYVAYSLGINSGLHHAAHISTSVPAGSQPGSAATDYNGANGRIESDSASGFVDTKTLAFNLWARRLTSGVFQQIFLAASPPSNPGFQLNFTAGNKFRVHGRNAAGTVILSAEENGTTTDTNWHQFYGAVDLANPGNSWMYKDATSQSTAAWTQTNDLIDLTTAEYSYGASQAQANPYHGELSESWLATNQFLANTQANREKLRTAGGLPANLGSDGSAVTGLAPRDYLPNGQSQQGSGPAYALINAPAIVPGPNPGGSPYIHLNPALAARFGAAQLNQRLFVSLRVQNPHGRRGPQSTLSATSQP